jgi:hypothetical protein
MKLRGVKSYGPEGKMLFVMQTAQAIISAACLFAVDFSLSLYSSLSLQMQICWGDFSALLCYF